MLLISVVVRVTRIHAYGIAQRGTWHSKQS